MNRKPSKAAKAAAVLVFTSGVDGYDSAVRLYDELGSTFDPVDDVLGRHGAVRWSPLQNFEDSDWWEEVEMLAVNITATRQHFGD